MWVCKVVLQSFQNFCFLTRDGGFRCPHVVIQSIITHPTHCFHDGSEFVQLALLHVVLTVANHCCRVHPQACRTSGSHPVLFIPSSDVVHHCNGTGELRFRLYVMFQALSLTSAFGRIRPVISSNNFSHSSRGSLVDKRHCVRLSSNHRTKEQMPEHLGR